ncbi:MoxR family ATPase [Hymenobacter sp. 5317J-9]|uniref:AAA family ATPase n=1 Tax=Hymenobacter sp. 5317J-9 TaxID=2932250 RepID=UPI001FD65853|nr:MoxR family ATPase [Hymenobacter sp. 5317J-9]UOQ98508.1 MoxR family ATPase [Hymenobacter sp. 5317J-9]
MAQFPSDKEAADALAASFQKLRQEIGKVIVGQDEVVRLVLTAVFSQGHSLLVGVPGLAKTLLIQTIADSLDLSFNRIQFTPDLMPSDIVGSETMNQQRDFTFVKGPVFANIILADEINRTPPKTQAALLESMQEYAVTVAGQRYALQRPFFVLATQNPIEQEGTYPLPEAQLDRFMFNIELGYPSYAEELNIVKNTTSDRKPTVNKVLHAADIQAFQELVRRVPVADNVVEYAVGLVHKTRPNTERAHARTNQLLEWGAGPRASQHLIVGAKCNALLNGKYSPDIEDVRAVAVPILRHRLVRNFKAEAEGIGVEQIVKELL